MTQQVAIVKHDAPDTRLATSNPELVSKLDSLWRLASCAVAGNFAPRGLETKEKAFAAMAFGDELGFPPMASLRCIGVVNGKPGLYAEGILAVVHKSGQLESQAERIDGEGEGMVAVCAMCRRGRQPIEGRYSVADAKKAGLWGKQGPWSSSPKDMLMWKARHRAVKASFSDLLMGVDCVEDLQEIPHEHREITIAATTPAEPVKSELEDYGDGEQVQPEHGTEQPPADEPKPVTEAEVEHYAGWYVVMEDAAQAADWSPEEFARAIAALKLSQPVAVENGKGAAARRRVLEAMRAGTLKKDGTI